MFDVFVVFNFSVLVFLLLAVNGILVSGCAPIVIGTAGVAGGVMIARDKETGTAMNDVKIETAIKAKIYKISAQLYSDVSVLVDRGMVLLTGSVDKEDYVYECEKVAWSIKGVNVVHNNISVGDRISFGVLSSDSWITSKSRMSLLGCSGVKSINYKLKTMNGVVYVIGTAASNEELDKALMKIQNIDGVKRVVSYVSVED